MSWETAATSMLDSPKYTGPPCHFNSCSEDLLCELILLNLIEIKGIRYLAELSSLFFALMREVRRDNKKERKGIEKALLLKGKAVKAYDAGISQFQ